MKHLLLIYFSVFTAFAVAQTTASKGGPKQVALQESPAENSKSALVEVYPIPASNEVNIRLDYSFHKSSVKLYSINGTAVLNEELSGYENKVDISSLPDGFYFCEIISDGKLVKVARVIKK